MDIQKMEFYLGHTLMAEKFISEIMTDLGEFTTKIYFFARAHKIGSETLKKFLNAYFDEDIKLMDSQFEYAEGIDDLPL